MPTPESTLATLKSDIAALTLADVGAIYILLVRHPLPGEDPSISTFLICKSDHAELFPPYLVDMACKTAIGMTNPQTIQ